jgi:ubiquinone/menaquinone biosynthesis C-methylase UbiE
MNSRQFFDDVAHEWEERRKRAFSEQVREKAIAVALVQGEQLAADIGAGTGFITEGLIKRGLKVIAVDQSKAMLLEMKQKFSSVIGIEYCMGDAEHLPLSDEVVDFVFANMCLHHVASPSAAISEMVRILRGGGRLVVTDLDEHDFEFLKKERRDRWLGLRREDVNQWFIKAGLKNVVVGDVGEDCCTQSDYSGEHVRISIFVASGEK